MVLKQFDKDAEKSTNSVIPLPVEYLGGMFELILVPAAVTGRK